MLCYNFFSLFIYIYLLLLLFFYFSRVLNQHYQHYLLLIVLKLFIFNMRINTYLGIFILNQHKFIGSHKKYTKSKLTKKIKNDNSLLVLWFMLKKQHYDFKI